MTLPDLARLDIDQKIGQLFFIGISGPELDAETERLLDDIRPGGVCLFARNIKSLEQTRSLLDAVRDSLPVEPLLSLDQEGGRVDRLRRVLTPMPAADRIRTTEHARVLGEIVGESISLLGFNMDFAPVVDVIDESRSSFINGLQTRGLGSAKEETVALAGAFIEGLDSHGVVPCIKHFPGLAAAEVDSHEELPVVSIGDDELGDIDLYPYRELLPSRERVSVMVAHAAFPNSHLQERYSDGKLLPSSLSKSVVTSLLRDELKFNGVAITDDMEMGAILRNYGIGQACTMALVAGEDMLAICASPQAIREGFVAVKTAVERGEISEDRIDHSLRRIAHLKASLDRPKQFNLERLREVDDRIIKLNEHLN